MTKLAPKKPKPRHGPNTTRGKAVASLTGCIQEPPHWFRNGEAVNFLVRVDGVDVLVGATARCVEDVRDRLAAGAGVQVKGNLHFRPSPRLSAWKIMVWRRAPESYAELDPEDEENY